MDKIEKETMSRSNVLRGCQRSMRYHQARARFFDTFHRWIQFFVFALASANVAHLIDSWLADWSITLIWAIVGVLALSSLVFNPAGKHTLHNSLYRGFTLLHGKVSAYPDADDKMRGEWIEGIHALYADEPPVYRALLARCDNQVVIALGADRKYLAPLRLHHRMFYNFFPFQGYEFISQDQIDKKKDSSS